MSGAFPKAIFLDRDGVITAKLGVGEYVLRKEDLRFDEEAVTALAQLSSFDVQLFIVTNQSCVGRGMLTREDAEQIQMQVHEQLANANVTIVDHRLCPHVTEDGCVCRKPQPGMIVDLCTTYGIDPSDAVMVGDSVHDALAGLAAGVPRVFLIDKQGSLVTPQGVQVVSGVSDVISFLIASYE